MTALATIPAAAAPDNPASFDNWLTIGRDLARTRLTIDFSIGDWIAYGREQFGAEQIELALGEIAADVEQVRALRRVEKVARAFPPSQRHAELSFEHHANLADLPTQDALPLLLRAGKEHLTARQVRVEAMLRKVDLGMVLPREDDPEYDAMLALCRAWNRAPVGVREDFAFMVGEAEDAGFRIIEP